MKKYFIYAVTLLCITAATAQEDTLAGFSSGDTFISGSINYSNSKNGDLKVNQFIIAPRAGYFLTNNIALGATVSYGINKTEGYAYDDIAATATITSTNLGAGLFGRYYFRPGSIFSVFTELGVAYNTGKVEYEESGAEFKTNGFNASFSPGFNYFISEHFVLESQFGILSYGTGKREYGGDFDETTNSFNFGLNMSNIYLGLMYKF